MHDSLNDALYCTTQPIRITAITSKLLVLRLSPPSLHESEMNWRWTASKGDSEVIAVALY